MPKSLINPNHRYYCNENNFFDNGCVDKYSSLDEFLAEYKDADMDYNLLFRWDLRVIYLTPDEEETEEEFEEVYSMTELLSKTCNMFSHLEFKCFWMQQRKGIYRSSITKCTKEDEAKIREFLVIRYIHLKELWNPFNDEEKERLASLIKERNSLKRSINNARQSIWKICPQCGDYGERNVICQNCGYDE